MKRYKALAFIIVVLLSKTIYSQNILQGVIKDVSTNIPLQGAIIYIPDLKTGAYSDSLGNYSIKNIPAGNYLVETSLIGYGKKIETIFIKGITHKNYSLEQFTMSLNDVTITGVLSATERQKNPVPIGIMTYKDLLENSSTNVIDAITKVPGVSAITDGQSISKPVIRGLGYNRVLTINDGVEQVDQAWFDEFGIEADPDAVNRYEILKGPGIISLWFRCYRRRC